MRTRKIVGEKNDIGLTVVKFRREKGLKQKDLLAQMQTRGLEIGETSLSMLEGQHRAATDRELRVLAEIFNVEIEELYNQE